MKAEAERLAEACDVCASDNSAWRLMREAAALLRQWPDGEVVAWVSAASLASSRIERERGGLGDQHTWSETKTHYHATPLYATPPDSAARIAELENAIDGALASAHIGTLESFPNPRAAIHALEAWNATVALDPAVSQDAAKLHERIAALEREVETERMRLVAVAVVAAADTPESAASARAIHEDYRGATLETVIRRVDECIALREALKQVREALEHLNNVYSGDSDLVINALSAIEKVQP